MAAMLLIQTTACIVFCLEIPQTLAAYRTLQQCCLIFCLHAFCYKSLFRVATQCGVDFYGYDFCVTFVTEGARRPLAHQLLICQK